MNKLNPQQLAQAAAEAMFARDSASQGMGMTLVEVAPGSAQMKMQVRKNMANGHGICHGGYIFSLADSTFAFACNSYNFSTVSAGARIEHLQPAKLGDELLARAAEVAQSGRSGIYDVTVTDQHDTIIALFRGNSRRISGHVVAELAE